MRVSVIAFMSSTSDFNLSQNRILPSQLSTCVKGPGRWGWHILAFLEHLAETQSNLIPLSLILGGTKNKEKFHQKDNRHCRKRCNRHKLKNLGTSQIGVNNMNEFRLWGVKGRDSSSQVSVCVLFFFARFIWTIMNVQFLHWADDLLPCYVAYRAARIIQFVQSSYVICSPFTSCISVYHHVIQGCPHCHLGHGGSNSTIASPKPGWERRVRWWVSNPSL